MMTDLHLSNAHPQKVIVVTGASTGIGLATAQYLARRGYTVFGSVRKAVAGEQFVNHPNLEALLMDVTDEASIKSALQQVQTHLQPDDEVVGLVNNAGIAVSGPLAHVPLDQVRQQFEVNVIGLLGVTQAFLPLLQSGCTPGRIVNISSVAGRVATPFLGPYAASKHAVEALSDTLRRELMPFGVKVIVIQPGPIATPIWSKGADESIQLYKHTPYGTLLQGVQKYLVSKGRTGLPPEAVARIVLHVFTIANPRTRYLVTQGKLEAYFSRFLPDKSLDQMIFKRMRLDRIARD